ncbi:hypothetical protein N7540_000757 [Penicillium herquei]|nr:hypothetical protein N7540_000757 [Penicillium herquei]
MTLLAPTPGRIHILAVSTYGANRTEYRDVPNLLMTKWLLSTNKDGPFQWSPYLLSMNPFDLLRNLPLELPGAIHHPTLCLYKTSSEDN